MKRISGIACVAVCALFANAEPWVTGDPRHRPVLFKQFGDLLNTPDGLAMDSSGNVYLSAVNGIDGTYPGHIWRMDKDTGKWSVFAPCKPHPKTHAAYPMGLAFDPGGNLYYADAQYFADPDYQSRIMRIVIKGGEPQRIETVAEHIKLPNALRWRDGALYFTESFFNVPGSYQSGIYRIPSADLNAERPVRLMDKAQAAHDPYCVGIVETVLRDRGAANGKPGVKPTDPTLHIYTAGCDGLDFDREGNLYTGSFGDGRFWVLKPAGNGRFGAPELLSAAVTCCDGICFDPYRNRIILTASEQNALYAWDITHKSMTVLWANGETDGADGLLDQPCEAMMLDRSRMLVVNIDAPSPFMVNTKPDAAHTLSVIGLGRE
ncbi:MAG TPA: SMP-30/gluconolactonase/LRE family protein [Kiritimatiellia bacterium]|mgnify:CR=1 FL=1|nr:SMP-30/gluconolactonase/LRE family protein [Kiritimatiellia bacterium]HPS08274.1 SMP-30/gluconolactonase/LRE family protein [Kiritimatiellia bacterium]